MSKADNLRKARKVKNDEFYTRLSDIEKEIYQHEDYIKQFKNKVVLCNCDNPELSDFFMFFKTHFNYLGIKKLIVTHYNKDNSPSYKLEIHKSNNLMKSIKTPLIGNGDFQSEECINLLKEADIIVTNPPFSLFRNFINLLVMYGKKFIIIESKSAISYKEFFPLFKEGNCFVGYNSGNGTMYFKTAHTNDKLRSVPSYWYTNFDLNKIHKPLVLTKEYKGNELLYPIADNYNAISVDKVKNIPKDYYGMMLVPITFMLNYCPEQFDIVGAAMGWTRSVMSDEWKKSVGYNDSVVSIEGTRSYAIVNGVQLYHRIIIKRKQNSV